MRVLWILAAAVTIAAAFPSNANAGDGWRVVDTAGVVRVGGPGFMPVALTRDQELPSDAWIETASGRAVLVRGQETVIVEPNSRVQLPGTEVNGNTQVLQTLGAAIYKIGKQNKPHFQVDTPYMAAVVKGTAFTVTVDDDNAAVAVSEGLVQVSTPDQSDVEFVRPGFTALVSRENSSDIVIGRTPASDTQRTPDHPKHDGTGTQAVLIPVTIGNFDLDVKQVSSGLVSNDVTSIDLLPGKDITVPIKDTLAVVPTTIDAVVDAPVGVVGLGDSVEPPGIGGSALDVVPDPGNGIGGGVGGVVDTLGDAVDNIRGQGNGNAYGVGNGLALGHLKNGN